MSLKTLRVGSKTMQAVLRRRRFAAFALAAAALVVYAARPASTETAAVSTQATFMLERRITSVEQRLNTVELNLTRLEQQTRLSAPAAPTSNVARDAELQLLRSEVELLQRRVAEDECGLLKIDERTLTQQAREARRAAAAAREDPCRLNAAAPLRLSSRQ
jgi:hypothetical protein